VPRFTEYDKPFSITKRGGYREVPEEVVRSAAIDLDLDLEEFSDLPPVRTRRGEIGASLEKLSSHPSGLEVVIPRREHKGLVPESLRHELAHYKMHTGFGILSSGEVGVPEVAKRELEAIRLGEGKLTSYDIANVILRLYKEEGLSKSEAERTTSSEARKLGIPQRMIRYGTKLFRDYLVWSKREDV